MSLPLDLSAFDVLAIGFGHQDMCEPVPFRLESVVDRRDARHFRFRPTEPPELICDAVIAPVSLFAVPKSRLLVQLELAAGSPASPGFPPPAQWWFHPSLAAARDTGQAPLARFRRKVSRRALTYDTRLSALEYRELAEIAVREGDWIMEDRLRANTRAMADTGVLAWLAHADRGFSEPVRLARLDFATRFGLAVAGDSSAPLWWLETLVQALYHYDTKYRDREEHYHRVAQRLVLNPAVLRSRRILRRLIFSVGRFPDVRGSACRRLAQYVKEDGPPRDSLGQASVDALAAHCVH